MLWDTTGRDAAKNQHGRSAPTDALRPCPRFARDNGLRLATRCARARCPRGQVGGGLPPRSPPASAASGSAPLPPPLRAGLPAVAPGGGGLRDSRAAPARLPLRRLAFPPSPRLRTAAARCALPSKAQVGRSWALPSARSAGRQPAFPPPSLPPPEPPQPTLPDFELASLVQVGAGALREGGGNVAGTLGSTRACRPARAGGLRAPLRSARPAATCRSMTEYRPSATLRGRSGRVRPELAAGVPAAPQGAPHVLARAPAEYGRMLRCAVRRHSGPPSSAGEAEGCSAAENRPGDPRPRRRATKIRPVDTLLLLRAADACQCEHS